jgi:hypothetical protein
VVTMRIESRILAIRGNLRKACTAVELERASSVGPRDSSESEDEWHGGGPLLLPSLTSDPATGLEAPTSVIPHRSYDSSKWR